MVTVGMDVGGRSHAVARCRDGMPRADREVLRVSQSRAGFGALDAWLEDQSERVAPVTMESSGHYWMPLASHLGPRDIPVAVVNPLAAKYFAKSRLARTKSDPKVGLLLQGGACRSVGQSRPMRGDSGLLLNGGGPTHTRVPRAQGTAVSVSSLSLSTNSSNVLDRVHSSF